VLLRAASCGATRLRPDSLAGRRQGLPAGRSWSPPRRRLAAEDHQVVHRAGARVWGLAGCGIGKSSKRRAERERAGDGDVSCWGCGKEEFGLLGLIGPSDGEEKG